MLLYEYNDTREAIITNTRFSGERPVYLQIVEDVTLQISSGELPPGGRLLPVRDLAVLLGVNPNTVQRAFAELERRGLVSAPSTAGRFVTQNAETLASLRETQADQAAQQYVETMRRLGYTPEEAADRAARHTHWEGESPRKEES